MKTLSLMSIQEQCLALDLLHSTMLKLRDHGIYPHDLLVYATVLDCRDQTKDTELWPEGATLRDVINCARDGELEDPFNEVEIFWEDVERMADKWWPSEMKEPEPVIEELSDEITG